MTIQAQILDVLAKAQKETGAAVVLITHDLGVVAGAADDILVMYAGRPVERASIDDVFQHPSMRLVARRRLPASRADSGQPAVAGRHPEGMPVLATMPARHPGVLAV